MTTKPDYFERVRVDSANRWNQLEADPELAGPWNLLFKQVQSPEHVLSELLQNADDAEATEASAKVEDGVFVFSHNGIDFQEDHFVSLCRFGYSNKRVLHTIGFRGVGFKSTFSLGSKVELTSPTLSVYFQDQRFTEPIWQETTSSSGGLTTIKVAISDQPRLDRIKQNLKEWRESPFSLLFFNNLRRLVIGDVQLDWLEEEPGPVSLSRWMRLNNESNKRYLYVESDAATFPEEALKEIIQERMINEDEINFPPCRVSLVLGAEGRLFVVLPTGVLTKLPFASNAPFIQDPARMKIKIPEISPTNHWLLKRLGRLASDTMLAWLGNNSLAIQIRVEAYDLFPDLDQKEFTLEDRCGPVVDLEGRKNLKDKPLLLCRNGKLVKSKEALSYPEDLFDIWQEQHIPAFFDEDQRSALSNLITEYNLRKLEKWDVVKRMDYETAVDLLNQKQPPIVPAKNLIRLWSYIYDYVKTWRFDSQKTNLNIVLVQGKKTLHGHNDVVWLNDNSALNDEDLDFIAPYLLVMDPRWPRFLRSKYKAEKEFVNSEKSSDIMRSIEVMKILGFIGETESSSIINRVAKLFFASETPTIKNCVRIAQISAKMKAATGEHFHFVNLREGLIDSQKSLIHDPDGFFESILPEEEFRERLLHYDYYLPPQSCSQSEWDSWIKSGKSCLHRTVIPEIQKKHFIGASAQEVFHLRGGKGEIPRHYKSDLWLIEDWDYAEKSWTLWHQTQQRDPKIWFKLIRPFFLDRRSWQKIRYTQLFHVSKKNKNKFHLSSELLPGWALKLREVPCLPDSRGVLRRPIDLMRRTSETEAYLDVERFVHSSYDTERTRTLLRLLGVLDKPVGPESLLKRLQSLASTDNPPILEVEKWYRRLDLLVHECSTSTKLTV